MASLPSSSSPQSQSLPSPSPPPPPPPPIQIASSATLLSGAASGLVSCVLLQPLDLLKTRLQQANSQNAPIGTKTRRLAKTVEAVVQRDGIRGLWRGTWPTILRNVPGVALYFYSVTELRRMLALQPVRYLSKSNVDTGVVKATSTGNLLSGATARVAVGFMLCPITVVKARFESSNFSPQQNSTLLLSIRSIYAESGVRGLFRGFTATALRDAPYAGLYLMFYEQGKSIAERVGLSANEADAWKGRVASGLGAGSMATLLTHPFDILKTRLQTSTSRGIGITETLRSIYAQGPSSLFLDGLGLRCARKAASSAIGWGIFEGGRDLWLQRERRRRNDLADAQVRA